MKRNTFLKRFLSVMLILTLMVGYVLPGFALEPGQDTPSYVKFTQVDNDSVSASLTPNGRAELLGDTQYADTDVVRVSIVLKKASTIQAGFDTMNIAGNQAAVAYRNGLKNDQANLIQRIERSVQGEFDVVWNLTLAANIISAYVEYGQIETIEKMAGVAQVVLENQYLPNEATVTGDMLVPNMATSGGQIGSTHAWAEGYTGAGTRIAVIDTGTDTNHQSLNAMAFEYSLSLLAEAAGMSYEEYVDSLDLLDAEEIAAVADKLNIKDYLDPQQAYFSSKLPFGFNYKDVDYDITHDNDEQGEHGSHVAGIATANSWLYDGEGNYGKALDNVFMQGVAPDAQLLTMKVFGKDGSPYDSDYFAAIEDAIILGADVVNLSLGSVAPGRGTHSNEVFQSIMDELTESGVVVAISAGNSGHWAEYAENGGYLYNTDVSQDTVGQPGSFTNSLCVASVENDGMVGYYIDVNGNMFVYNEDNRDGEFSNRLFREIAGEYEYIFIDGIGKAEDWEAVADVLPGKIALCSRGETNFAEKANLAVAAGAVAVFIYNNQSGVINLDLTEYLYTNPVAAITKAQGTAIRELSTPVTDDAGNVLYLTGTMTISATIGMGYFGSDYYTMSDFSSWGVPGSLEMKPEITAPGGNIYSLNGLEPSGGGYEIMSGTSMASPQVAGMAALLAQYVRENNLSEKTGVDERHLIQSLLMSTAQPLLASEGVYYPVLQQGAGLANVYSAMTADSYIIMDENANAGAADGKVKVELFDDPDRVGSYTAAFTVYNLESVEKILNLRADFFIQALTSDGTYLYMDYSTTMIPMDVFWSVGGVATMSDSEGVDFNGDGRIDSDDGQALLDYATGKISSLYNMDMADVDGDGDVDSYDAYTYLAGLSTTTALIPANGAVEIRVEFNLSEEMKETLDTLYPNGTYLQGFLYAETEGEEDTVGTSHSIPVLGFYGNWTDPSMFDVGQWTTYATGEDTRIPYIGRTRGNDFKVVYDWDPGYNYSFGGNPLIPDAEYMPERNAMNSADSLDGVSFIAIRHADQSRVVVVNETTGEVMLDQQTGAANMAYYYGALGWQNSGMFLQTNFSLKNTAENDRVSMEFTLVPEYYIDAEGNVDWEALGEGASLSTSFVIDNTAPELLGVSIDVLNNTMTITASDNRYIAAAGLYNKTGTRCLAQTGAKQDIEEGEVADYTFSLDKINGKVFLVQVFDYAMNATTYMIEMQIGEETDLPTMMAYDLVSHHWAYFEKDFVYDYKVGTPLLAYADHTYYAATIAEHYAFASTSTGDLYVMPEDDLTDTTFITNMGQIMYDMAYNSVDGEIYAVNDANELFTIQKLTGELTRIGTIGLNTNTLACSPDGVFYCNELGTGKVYSFTLETMDAPELLMEDPFLTSTDPIYGTVMEGTTGNMGMEYNPNTNMICWNSHLEVLMGSYITFAYYYEIDPATGEFTRYEDFWHEMSGLMIPDRTGMGGGWADPTDEVSAVKLNRDELSMIRDTSARLTANVQPWTAIDRTVTWSSADESIATVDKNGVVTGVKEGTTTIRATSNLDPSFYAECTVTVEILNVTIHGTTTDAQGNTMFYDWDMSTYDGWTPGAALTEIMTSATYSDALDVFYMMDTVSGQWGMHKVSADGTILESAENTMGVAMWDMTYNPYFSQIHGQERVSGIYYYYLLSPKNPMGMDSVGFDLGSMTNYLVGITSLGYEQVEDENGNVYDSEHLILLDDAGYIWDFWIYDVEGGMNALFNITGSDLDLEFPGDSTMDNMFTSLMAGEDGNLYLSSYTETTSEIYHLSYDPVGSQYVAVKIGDMGENVWPATITSVTVNTEAAGQNAAHPAPRYSMSATAITGEELAAASVSGKGAKESFTVTEEERNTKHNILYSDSNALTLSKNDLESGVEYTYIVPADGRMEFSVGSVYNSAGSKQYSWYNGSKVQILINGKAMTGSTAKMNVTAGQVITVEIVSLDGDTYTADMTLKEIAAAETLVIGNNENIQQDLEYVYVAEQDGTVHISIVELLYNGEQCAESELSGNVRFYVNGKTVSTFTKSVDVLTGDEVLIMIDDYSWNSSGVPVAIINLSYEGFYEHPQGSMNNPVELLYADCPAQTIEIPAGSAVWYELESYYDDSSWSTVYPFADQYLVITGEGAYVMVDGTRYDAVDGVVKVLMDETTLIQIGNDGDLAAIFDIEVQIPEGHEDNPQDLMEGDNTVEVPRYGSHYFDFVAAKDGVVTITISGEYWRVYFYHYDAEGNQLAQEDRLDTNGDSNVFTVEIKAGESLLLNMGTKNGYSQPGGEITVNFHFEADAEPEPEPEPENLLTLSKNDLESGVEYTYIVPADGRMEFSVGSVYNSAGSKQYSWYNGSKVQILINGKAMTGSTAKMNVTAGQVITVEIVSLDGDTYTADMTLKEIAAAETLVIGNNNLAQDLEYVYVVEQDGTVYVSVVEMLYNGQQVTADVLGSSVQMTINGSSVSVFSKSYEVKSGDEIAIVIKDYSWDGSGTVSAVINLSLDGFYEHPQGSMNNPVELLYTDCPAQTIEIPAGSAVWYKLESYYDDSSWSTVYPFSGRDLIIEGENAYVIVGSTRYDAVDGVVTVRMDSTTMIQIGNDGDVAAVFAISVAIPEGDQDNPQDLVEGDNVINLGSYKSHYFDFVATEDGTVTITMSGENWRVYFYHYGADGAQLAQEDRFYKNGDSDTFTVEIKTGESIVLNVGTSKGYSQPGGEITVNFHFEEAAEECQHSNTRTEIVNEQEATCVADGSYETVVYCADCGVELSRETTTIPATGHEYADGICVNCGAEDPDYVPENYVFVEVTLDVDATNGIFVVTWDPAKMILVDVDVNADFISTLDGEGTLTVGYVCLAGIPAGEAIATLTFEALDPEAAVTVVHEEINNEHFCLHSNTEIRNAVDANCVEDGYSGDIYCTDCGEQLAEGEMIAAYGHSYVDGECEHCGQVDPDAVLMGDVNGDSVINYLDAMLIAQHYVGMITADELTLAAADVNGDGVVNYLDAMLVAQFYVGMIDSFE